MEIFKYKMGWPLGRWPMEKFELKVVGPWKCFDMRKVDPGHV